MHYCDSNLRILLLIKGDKLWNKNIVHNFQKTDHRPILTLPRPRDFLRAIEKARSCQKFVSRLHQGKLSTFEDLSGHLLSSFDLYPNQYIGSYGFMPQTMTLATSFAQIAQLTMGWDRGQCRTQLLWRLVGQDEAVLERLGQEPKSGFSHS